MYNKYWAIPDWLLWFWCRLIVNWLICKTNVFPPKAISSHTNQRLSFYKSNSVIVENQKISYNFLILALARSPIGEMSVWRDVRLARCPGGEVSAYRWIYERDTQWCVLYKWVYYAKSEQQELSLKVMHAARRHTVYLSTN